MLAQPLLSLSKHRGDKDCPGSRCFLGPKFPLSALGCLVGPLFWHVVTGLLHYMKQL